MVGLSRTRLNVTKYMDLTCDYIETGSCGHLGYLKRLEELSALFAGPAIVGMIVVMICL
jgi:hypothetical protein